MANSTDQNEYKVQRDADIEEDLKNYNVDIATTLFEAIEIEKVMENSDSTGSSDEDSNSGKKDKKSLVKFGDGKANTLLIMQQAVMDIPSGKLDGKKKEAIEKKAEKSKEAQEQEADKDVR